MKVISGAAGKRAAHTKPSAEAAGAPTPTRPGPQVASARQNLGHRPVPSKLASAAMPPRQPQPRLNPKLNPVTSPAAQHLGKLDANGTFVATGKWSEPNESPRAPPGRMKPLMPHENHQAAYQLGARLNGNPIEDARTRQSLAQATDTVHETRTDLGKFGRGNIQPDVMASQGESAVRAATAYTFSQQPDTQAGVALALGAGNCDHHAAINARRHAAKAQDGSTTLQVGSHHYHHSYVVHNPVPGPATVGQPDGAALRPPSIVLDSWADGPAVRYQDSTWAKSPEKHVTVSTFDNQSGAAAKRAMDEAREQASRPGTPINRQTQSQLDEFRLKPPSFESFEPSSAISTDFARQARQNLKTKDKFASEVMAVGAARQAYNLSVATATQPETTDGILRQTRRLQKDRPPRPPESTG